MQKLYNNLYKDHNDFSFKKSGLVISDDYPLLGASPDVIAYCDCCGQHVVEIKYPYTLKKNGNNMVIIISSRHISPNSVFSAHEALENNSMFLWCNYIFSKILNVTFFKQFPI